MKNKFWLEEKYKKEKTYKDQINDYENEGNFPRPDLVHEVNIFPKYNTKKRNQIGKKTNRGLEKAEYFENYI